MINQLGNKLGYVLVASTILLLSSCGKLVDVEEPRDSITTEKMFQSESKIEEVLTGIYTVLINGPTGGAVAPRNEFAAALTTLAGAQSSGEFAASAVIDPGIPGGELWRINRSYANAYWESAYNVVYLCNSLMEGIAESNSSTVRDSVKTQYMAEARLIRAFCYLYLSSFFWRVVPIETAPYG